MWKRVTEHTWSFVGQPPNCAVALFHTESVLSHLLLGIKKLTHKTRGDVSAAEGNTGFSFPQIDIKNLIYCRTNKLPKNVQIYDLNKRLITENRNLNPFTGSQGSSESVMADPEQKIRCYLSVTNNFYLQVKHIWKFSKAAPVFWPVRATEELRGLTEH